MRMRFFGGRVDRRLVSGSLAVLAALYAGCGTIVVEGDKPGADAPPGGPSTGTAESPNGTISPKPPTPAPTADPQAPAESTLLANMTFETKKLTGDDAANETTGNVLLETTSTIAGAASLEVSGTNAFAGRSFPAVNELYVSFLYRLDSKSGEPKLIKIRPTSGDPVIVKLGVDAGGVKVAIGDKHRLDETMPLYVSPAKTYRIGLHVISGTGTAKVEAFAVEGCKPFEMPFSTTSALTIATTDAVLVGSMDDGAMTATFDQVRVDVRSMPGCD